MRVGPVVRWYIDRPVQPVAAAPRGTPPAHEFRIKVTCEVCRFEQRLERKVTEPGALQVICHSCETPLTVNIPVERFASWSQR